MARGLTPKQEKFVLGLIEGKSQRQAYKDAGYNTTRMSDNSMDVAACRLSQNSKVKLRYDELMAKMEAESIMSATEVLQAMSKIGRADIGDYLEYRTAETVVDFDGEKVKDYAMVVIAKDSTEVDTAPISEVKLSKDGTFSFKLYSKADALRELAKYHKLTGDTIRIDAAEDSNIIKAIESTAPVLFDDDPDLEDEFEGEDEEE